MKNPGGHKELCFLALGEPAFGTAIYDPALMDGLVTYLHANPQAAKKINYLIINGGLVPEIPSFHSEYNAIKMRFLASDPTKPPNPKVQEILDTGDVDDRTKTYLERFALHII